MLIRNRVSRIFFLQKFFDYPIKINPQIFVNMGLFRTINSGLGYIFSSLKKRKENSLEDFYINRFGKPLYKMFFEDYTQKVWGVHPSEISPEWGSQRVKGLSLSKALKNMIFSTFSKKYKTSETSLIEQFLYPKFGPGQLWHQMAKYITDNGGKIIFNAKVFNILTENSFIKSLEYKTPDKNIHKLNADIFISSMSIKDLIISLGKSPSEEIKDIALNLPYRDFITVGLLLKKLKIKNKTKIKTVNNIVPDCWIYIQEKDVKIGRLQIFNNWSPYMLKDFENTVWIGLEYFCNEGDTLWKMSKEEFINFAIDELVKINIIDKNDLIDSTCIKVKKAYPAYFGTYKQFDKVKDYLNSFQNLYCVGRNGQHRYNNMDHSMLTAIKAVDVIKNGSNDKSSIWNVNTEEGYHEEN